jgi:hypothetical protein
MLCPLISIVNNSLFKIQLAGLRAPQTGPPDRAILRAHQKKLRKQQVVSHCGVLKAMRRQAAPRRLKEGPAPSMARGSLAPLSVCPDIDARAGTISRGHRQPSLQLKPF